jgi:hypothetical protein
MAGSPRKAPPGSAVSHRHRGAQISGYTGRIVTFVLQMMSALGEPLGVAGYLLSGLMLSRLWAALLASLGWAAAIQVWEIAQVKAQHAVPAFELLFARLTVATVLACVAFLAIDAWRRRRTTSAS